MREYALSADESPSRGVSSTVAVLENCSPLDLTPLAEATDPDALNTLLAGETGTEEVSFRYCGYDVTATADEIRVREPEVE